MSAKIAAVVTHQNATTDVSLEYDSKNKEPVETVTVAEVLTSTMVFNRAYTDSVTLAEEVLISTQYNLAFTESISSSEAVSWTSVQNIAESIGKGDTPGIGDIFHYDNTYGWIILLNGVYYEYARWNCPYRQINNFS